MSIICRFFGHTMRPIKARFVSPEDRKESGIVGLFGGTPTAYTTLLSRCTRCGFHETSTFPGEWSIADFQRTNSADDERAEFEKIVGLK